MCKQFTPEKHTFSQYFLWLTTYPMAQKGATISHLTFQSISIYNFVRKSKLNAQIVFLHTDPKERF